VRDVPVPEPGPGAVRVRIETIGVNYAEVLSRKGLYGWAPQLPYVLGMEAFGRLDAIGPGVEGRRPGEPVIVGTQHGCYAEAVAVPAARALPALPDFSPEENASFAVNYLTAWVALVEMGRLRARDRVLVTAAAGGVGTAAVQIAHRHGATVYGLAGSDEKLELVRRMGASAALNYRAGHFEEAVRRLTDGRGVDLVLEVVGGEVYRQCLRLLAPFGRVVVAGFAGLDLQRWNPWSWWRTWRDIPRADVRAMLLRSYSVGSTHLGYLLRDVDLLGRVWSDLVAFTREQGVRPVVGARFSLEDGAAAHALVESRRSQGKVVLAV
jgi:NADPH2:quinone reductase